MCGKSDGKHFKLKRLPHSFLRFFSYDDTYGSKHVIIFIQTSNLMLL
jgi:hypothetical protein